MDLAAANSVSSPHASSSQSTYRPTPQPLPSHTAPPLPRRSTTAIGQQQSNSSYETVQQFENINIELVLIRYPGSTDTIILSITIEPGSTLVISQYAMGKFYWRRDGRMRCVPSEVTWVDLVDMGFVTRQGTVLSPEIVIFLHTDNPTYRWRRIIRVLVCLLAAIPCFFLTAYIPLTMALTQDSDATSKESKSIAKCAAKSAASAISAGCFVGIAIASISIWSAEMLLGPPVGIIGCSMMDIWVHVPI